MFLQWAFQKNSWRRHKPNYWTAKILTNIPASTKLPTIRSVASQQKNQILTLKALVCFCKQMLINMSTKYTGIMSTIELKEKNRTTNLESTILRLVKYKAIWKGNNAKLATEQPVKTTILLSSSKWPKTESLWASKETYTNPEYVQKNVISHYTEHCFLKYLKLCQPKYLFYQIKPKGSKKNLQNDNLPISSNMPTTNTATLEPPNRGA